MSETAVERLDTRALSIPTDGPEQDGTLSWDATGVVLVQAQAGGQVGVGYSYCDPAGADLARRVLADAVIGADALSPPAAWQRMRATVRNVGFPGIASGAISAVDVALWDLKARLLGVSLSKLLGRVREGVPIYGSGGFVNYSDQQLERQLGEWAAAGMGMVKMKVGADPAGDRRRVRRARAAIGEQVELFADANGAYERKQALCMAEAFAAEAQVSWFEEPVSSDDLDGLRLLRDRAPARMRIAAGEYGYDLFYFKRMLDAGAVDALQADVTRCGGITQFQRVAALCQASALPLSAHTAPALHAHVGAATTPLVHVEYFHDHVRIERMLFDGLPALREGALHPDAERPGHGLELREADARRYEI